MLGRPFRIDEAVSCATIHLDRVRDAARREAPRATHRRQASGISASNSAKCPRYGTSISPVTSAGRNGLLGCRAKRGGHRNSRRPRNRRRTLRCNARSARRDKTQRPRYHPDRIQIRRDAPHAAPRAGRELQRQSSKSRNVCASTSADASRAGMFAPRKRHGAIAPKPAAARRLQRSSMCGVDTPDCAEHEDGDVWVGRTTLGSRCRANRARDVTGMSAPSKCTLVLEVVAAFISPLAALMPPRDTRP